MSRDIVKVWPDIRLDYGDVTALQRNARSDLRAQFGRLLFGPRAGTAAAVRRVLHGFEVVEDPGGPSSVIRVNSGTASSLEAASDGDEAGVLFGFDEPSQQSIDLAGMPAATYTVYVKFIFDPGAPATRIFWNATTSSEDVDTRDTRLIATWAVQVAASSPGDEWLPVAKVNWNESSVSTVDITMTRDLFFEGDESNSYADTWGDGANDRDSDRGTYGIGDLYTWVQAVRRQLSDIIGTAWYAEPVVDLETAATARRIISVNPAAYHEEGGQSQGQIFAVGGEVAITKPALYRFQSDNDWATAVIPLHHPVYSTNPRPSLLDGNGYVRQIVVHGEFDSLDAEIAWVLVKQSADGTTSLHGRRHLTDGPVVMPPNTGPFSMNVLDPGQTVAFTKDDVLTFYLAVSNQSEGNGVVRVYKVDFDIEPLRRS